MKEQKEKDQFRQDTPKTQQGGNPKQHDDPSHDEHHDENRVNLYKADRAS